ncbi:MAG: hypothetical protein QM638_09400, partial [Nocardioides sp.]
MSAPRFSRLQKATALVPLAVLSVAWTVNVAGLTESTASASSGTPTGTATLPDGTTVPDQAIDSPASVTSQDGGDDKVSSKTAKAIVSTASASGIPAAALAAYQRAATVIDQADKTCHLDWQLIAAIGR